MEEISPTKQNILQYIDFKGISKAVFCRETGMSYENFKGKSLKSDIGGAILGKIITIFDDISAEWLLTGKGNMLKDNATTLEQPSNTIETPLDSTERSKMLDTISTQAHIIERLQLKIESLERLLSQNEA